MLLLGNKTITVEGVTVFADHADPNQFWYLPTPVKLVQRPGDHQSTFTCIKYKPAAVAAGAKGGGFLLFEVNLRLDSQMEQRILAKLTAIAPQQPKLSAVPFDSGNVECLALNLQGGGGITATPAAPGTFNAVEKILGATIPSLDATNTATFGLTLSQEGTIILEKAFEQATTPIGVLYNLKYTGMRPALDVKITADLKRVYNQFSASLSGQYYFFKLGIEAALESLVQDGAIKIEVVQYSDAADKEDKAKWALEFFRDSLLRDWFEPTLTPGTLSGSNLPDTSNPTPLTNGGTSSSNSGLTPPAADSRPNSNQLKNAGENLTAAAAEPFTSQAPATLEILSRDPNPLPAGYQIDYTPATTGTTEILTIRGGNNPTVKVNGTPQTLNSNQQCTVDVANGATADVVVEYPQTTTDETFHLFFDFEKPRESGWSTNAPIYNSYLNNTPNPADAEFSNTTSHPGITTVVGSHRSGDSNQLREWLQNRLVIPKNVTIEAYASFENDDSIAKQRYNRNRYCLSPCHQH
jgi:hypothetical protein